MKDTTHIMVTELDCENEHDLKELVTQEDIFQDIKFLMSEYYIATFTTEGDCLIIVLSNGQSFRLSVVEI